jgi:Fe2+ transport system protein A
MRSIISFWLPTRTLRPSTAASRPWPGITAKVVVAVSSQGELGRRLKDMGITPGVKMEMFLYAPLKDPIAYRLLGCVLSLRRKEAAEVLVEPYILS